jgi:hypothetical protein
LDEVLLWATESSLVGNVEDSKVGLWVLSVNTTNLDIVLVSDSLELCLILGKKWELNMDWSSHGGTKVGGAWGDVTEVLVVSELDDLLDFGGTTGEAVENGVEVSTLLHSNNSKLILFVNPDKEGLVFVVEDTTTVGPVTVKVAWLEETISFPKTNCC